MEALAPDLEALNTGDEALAISRYLRSSSSSVSSTSKNAPYVFLAPAGEASARSAQFAASRSGSVQDNQAFQRLGQHDETGGETDTSPQPQCFPFDVGFAIARDGKVADAPRKPLL